MEKEVGLSSWLAVALSCVAFVLGYTLGKIRAYREVLPIMRKFTQLAENQLSVVKQLSVLMSKLFDKQQLSDMLKVDLQTNKE